MKRLFFLFITLLLPNSVIGFGLGWKTLTTVKDLDPELLKKVDDSGALLLDHCGLEALEDLSELITDKKKVKKLDLAHNKVRRIRSKHFEGFDNLVELDLRGNSILQIEPEAFSRLLQLKVLHLGSNRLRVLSPRLFPQGLEALHLDHNFLTSLVNRELRGLYSLKELDLSYNLLSKFEKEVFTDLLELEDLNLKSNGMKKLITLPEEVFSKLKKLKVLNIQDICLARFPRSLMGLVKDYLMGESYSEIFKVFHTPHPAMDQEQLFLFQKYSMQRNPSLPFPSKSS